MDFGALPPEVNSGRMYLGPGPATLLAASAGWESLAAELHATAGGYQSVIAGLTEEWLGATSMSMAAAVAPYVSWLIATAEQCEQTATQATTAAGAYEAAHAMTVPPPLVATNRLRLLTLTATNFLGQNTPAIMATEAEYSEMWAQDATAMYTYAANSASASALTTFTSPPQTTNPGGLAGQTGTQAGSTAQASGTQAGSTARTTMAQMMSSTSQALQGLSTPGSSSSVGLSQTAMGTVSGLASSLGGAGVFDVASDAIGVSSDMAGLGADGAGLGTDGGGIGFDAYGLSLDFEGAGSIIGAEGAGGFPGLGNGFGNLGDLGGLRSFGPLGSFGGLGGGASASVGNAASLGTLAVPPSWADAVASVVPLPELDANVMPGGWGAGPSITTGPGVSGPAVSKLPLGGMIGRESDGAVQRVGFRSTLIPRSPVAG